MHKYKSTCKCYFILRIAQKSCIYIFDIYLFFFIDILTKHESTWV